MTIQEVAKIANVSAATVSRVLNNDKYVKRETYEHVSKVIDELGYRPNALGRHLRTQSTKTILVMLSNIANTLSATIVSAIEKAGRSAGYSILICATNDEFEREKNYLKLLEDNFADGIIILNTLMKKDELEAFAKNHNIVQCCEYLETKNAPYVAIDNEQAAYDATEHLIKSGRRKIAYLGVVNHLISSKLRWAGYVKALEKNGIEIDHSLVADGNYGFRSAITLINNFFVNGQKPDALFAISDRMAAGAIRAAKDFGFSVPKDIAVVGFDNTDISYVSDPAITTISQSPKFMGEQTFELMLKKINKEKNIKNITVPHEIIVRDSSNA